MTENQQDHGSAVPQISAAETPYVQTTIFVDAVRARDVRSGIVAYMSDRFSVHGDVDVDDDHAFRSYVFGILRENYYEEDKDKKQEIFAILNRSMQLCFSDRDHGVNAVLETPSKPEAPCEDAGLSLFLNHDDDFETPVSLPRVLLPGPISGFGPEAIQNWIMGKPWSQTTMAVCFDAISESLIEDLAEIETEIFSGSLTRFEAGNAWPPLSGVPSEKTLSWFNAVEPPAASTGSPDAASRWCRALERVIADIAPSCPAMFRRLGARLVPADMLVTCLEKTLQIEAFLLSECDIGEEEMREAYDPAGGISPQGRLYRGMTFDHAAWRHLLTGEDVVASLHETLKQLRFAQFLREADPQARKAVSACFDAMFDSDCFRPVASYCEPVVPEPEMIV